MSDVLKTELKVLRSYSFLQYFPTSGLERSRLKIQNFWLQLLSVCVEVTREIDSFFIDPTREMFEHDKE